MKILLTGVTDYIGSHLVEPLKYENDLYALVDPSADITKMIVFPVFFTENCELLHTIIQENCIEGIIHLSDLNIVHYKTDQIKDLILSNIYHGTLLLESSLKTNVKWFLNIGTIRQNYIYNSEEYCPANLYAATKQAFIDIAKYYTEISNINFCTLKLCDTYGIGDTEENIFSSFKQSAETGNCLALSPGEQKKDLLYIDDVVNGIMKMVDLLHSKRVFGKNGTEHEYVLTAEEKYTLKDLASIYEEVTKKKLNIVWGVHPYDKREVMNPWIKGRIVPGWKSSVSLREGIKKLTAER